MIDTIVAPVATPPAAPAKTVRDVLLHAALLIEERGWCQGLYEAPDGRLCAIGALSVASGGDADIYVGGAADEALARIVCTAYIPHWNDATGRTAAEVIAALRAAAEATDG